MDSRLISGAYSQHFRALEREENETDERSDSITRAKKLSQETNKRRKIQAQKRKLEAKREEKRRQEILTKRREEQKQATEKYQRSHVPAGQRQNSGRLSPQRYGAPCLDDALQLIRRTSPRRERPVSGRERVHSPKHENDDPLKRSYFNKPRHHSARPSSGRASHQLNNEARNELMDFSLKNLTSSKSLFEQQLEQQQNILLQKQQQSVREFSNAIQRELGSENDIEIQDSKGDAENSESLSGSCSSLDSLERSAGDIRNEFEKDSNPQNDNRLVAEHSKQSNDQAGQQNTFYLNPYSSEREKNDNTLSGHSQSPLNYDMTPSALFQTENVGENGEKKSALPLSSGFNEVTKLDLLEQQGSNLIQDFKSPLKQHSGDSLEGSVSSGSVISVIKLPENNDSSNKPTELEGVQAEMKDHQNNEMKQQSLNKNDQSQVSSNGSSANVGKNEPVVDSYNPRYASAIGLSIWSGHPPPSSGSNSTGNTVASNHSTTATITTTSNNNNNTNSSPYGKRTSSTVIGPHTSDPIQQQKSSANNAVPAKSQTGNHIKTENVTSSTNHLSSTLPVASTGVSAKPFVPEIDNNMLNSFKKQDFIYPLSQNSVQNKPFPQNHTLLPSNSSTYNTLQQEIKQMSDQMLENNNTNIMTSSPSVQIVPNTLSSLPSSSLSAQVPATTMTAPSSCPIQHNPDRQQMIHHIPHGNEFVSGLVPVPAVRTIFPANKPPVPKLVAIGQHIQSGNNHQQVNSNAENVKQDDFSKSSKTNDAEQKEREVSEEDSENTKALKGILKPLPPKVLAQNNQKGSVQVRDSIELAKMHSEKKVKKKSVRWATFLEESEDDPHTAEQSNSHSATTSQYKQASNRPVSAKVVSQSAVASKPVRAASAGSMRQPMSLIQQQNLPQTSNININSQFVHNNTHKSNLPPNFSQPLNTAAPINRPKAAAHIIMSSESQHTIQKDGSSSPTSPTASSLHKSQLEVKVKAVNNNFMSKVPVKVNTNTNLEVYHVSNASNAGIHQSEQAQQNAERSRIRDNTSASKRVPLSNSTVTRTSIVPASTKINYPLPNGVAPSYSNNNSGSTSGNNAQGTSSSTFDENKIRLDKTPTDEEISWLWNKVRNCLDKEEEKGDNKQPASVGVDQPARQTPVLSTKIIDGNSLGFNTNGAPALRPGSGYFYTRNGGGGGGANSNGQNKIKPAVQQQGSYLRRYGLLQQRRANSASGTPSNPLAVQARAGSAGLARYPAAQTNQQTPQTQQQQLQLQQQAEGPKPIAFSYKPQDNVSESTAAFVMAERLAKQSLTDSHIAVAMEDAQNKQEVYNRGRMPAKAPAGPSALSLEEQRLMESLDRLNDKLNVPDQKSYSGTIHYHQPYQPHLPGFRGHQGYTNQRHHPPPSPRGQPRSQSARIRQQIRQYR